MRHTLLTPFAGFGGTRGLLKKGRGLVAGFELSPRLIAFFAFFAIKAGAFNSNFKTQKIDPTNININPFSRAVTI